MRSVISLILLLLLTACGYTNSPFLYKQDISQGNVYLPKEVAAIHDSMSRQEVHQILGTPQLNDVFRKDEDVYIYRYFSGDSKQTYQSTLTIHYVNERVASINHKPVKVIGK